MKRTRASRWLVLAAALLLPAQELSPPPSAIRFAGVRSSLYGIRPFPSRQEWKDAILHVRDRIDAAASPCVVWVVGTRDGDRSCRLEFPAGRERPAHVTFAAADRHEAFLDFFDREGISVLLQVEPMDADVPALIDLVLGRYGRHRSVIGFGVDVEWHREAERPARGVGVDDRLARLWEERVKSHNPGCRLFLKHWNHRWMPPRYRGDIIFVSDSQRLESFDRMCREFSERWAAHFAPNTVLFQIGYPRDRGWWSRLDDPPRRISRAVALRVAQPCGFIWVDFTLRELIAGAAPAGGGR